MGFPRSSVGKESACNAGERSLIPGSGRSAGEGIGHPLQYSWASLVAQLVKNLPAVWETWVNPWLGKIPWRREWLLTPVFWSGEFQGLIKMHYYYYYSMGSQSWTRLSNFHFQFRVNSRQAESLFQP